MNGKYLRIIDESIRLELNISDIYRIFSSTFLEHCNFWWQLAIEERNHAALLKSTKECFAPMEMVPADLVFPDLELLKSTNDRLELMIEKFSLTPPSQEKAFITAYELEKTAGEMHYQKFMDKKGDYKIEKIFQDLNGHDKDHAQRILSRMSQYQIEHTIDS